MKLCRRLGAAGLAMMATLACAATGAGAATLPGSWYTFTPNAALAPQIPAAGPTDPTPPSISGNAGVGQTLTAYPGNWTSTAPPISYTYQWETCDASGSNCNPNSDTNLTYQLTSTDVGTTLEFQVTAMDGNGTTVDTAGPTAVVVDVPAITGSQPSISGNAKQGSTLTANAGGWSGNPSFTYQWQTCDASGANCSNNGATGSTYPLTSADVGTTLAVVVTATNAAGSANATSGTTAVVVGPPVNTGPTPSISGNATQGSTLTANAGGWSGSPSFTYQWQTCDATGANCNNNSGTGQTYQLSSGDVGTTVRVVVTATDTGGSANAASAATAVVVGPPVNTGAAPSISGSATQGSTLTANAGGWSGSPSFTYQWQTCDATGANCNNNSDINATYVLGASDAGTTLRVVVTATNTAGSVAGTSAATAVVVGLPVNTALPAVTGSTVVGGTLDASQGTWNPSPTNSSGYSYQWQRCNALGAACVNVGTAHSTYAVGVADVGATLRVQVTATNTAGSVAATSAVTSVVTQTAGGPTPGFHDSILTPVPATGSPVTFMSTSTAAGLESITSTVWNFGDGSTGSGTTVSHPYSAPGTYMVTLTVTQSDNQTATTSATVTVDAPPTSSFTWNPGNPSAGTSLSFLSGASGGTGGIVSYSWTFGDGGSSTSANPTHTYTAAGTYTVTLSVLQSDGLTATAQHPVTVTGQSVGPASSTGPTATAAATRRWLAHVLASSHSPKIGALLSRNGVSSTLSAPHSSGHIAITWYATVRHHRMVVARGSAALRAGFSARVTIKLTATGRALLTRSKTLRITVSDTFRSGSLKATAVRTLTVRR